MSKNNTAGRCGALVSYSKNGSERDWLALGVMPAPPVACLWSSRNENVEMCACMRAYIHQACPIQNHPETGTMMHTSYLYYGSSACSTKSSLTYEYILL